MPPACRRSTAKTPSPPVPCSPRSPDAPPSPKTGGPSSPCSRISTSRPGRYWWMARASPSSAPSAPPTATAGSASRPPASASTIAASSCWNFPPEKLFATSAFTIWPVSWSASKNRASIRNCVRRRNSSACSSRARPAAPRTVKRPVIPSHAAPSEAISSRWSLSLPALLPSPSAMSPVRGRHRHSLRP